jgi:biotin-dependent carboxylase-like uncharacterized protein
MKPLLKLDKVTFPISYQDKGRKGWSKFGVARAGCMDSSLAILANRLVGNYSNEVLLEYAIGGVKLSILENCCLAIVGAGGMNLAKFYRAGDEIKIPALGDCMWGYIAVKGGFLIEKVLGSCSYHSRSCLGTELNEGSVIQGESSHVKSHAERHFAKRFISSRFLPNWSKDIIIHVLKGVHADQLDFKGFVSKVWLVSNQMDRSGYRLEGDFLPHSLGIRSLPVLPGCIQITPSGQPLITMNDGPTVGGYPLIGVIHPDDLCCVAQCTPGARIYIIEIDVDQL